MESQIDRAKRKREARCFGGVIPSPVGAFECFHEPQVFVHSFVHRGECPLEVSTRPVRKCPITCASIGGNGVHVFGRDSGSQGLVNTGDHGEIIHDRLDNRQPRKTGNIKF